MTNEYIHDTAKSFANSNPRYGAANKAALCEGFVTGAMWAQNKLSASTSQSSEAISTKRSDFNRDAVAFQPLNASTAEGTAYEHALHTFQYMQTRHPFNKEQGEAIDIAVQLLTQITSNP